MAVEGMQFSWLWNDGTIPSDIWASGKCRMKILLRWLTSRLAFRLYLWVVILLIVDVVIYAFRYELRNVYSALTVPNLEVALRTNLYPIDIKAIPVVMDHGRGGGLAMLGNALIFATTDGQFFIKGEASNEFEAMSLRLPMSLSELTSKFERYKDIVTLGLKGLAAREANGLVEVFAMHHHLFEDKDCYVLRLSKAVLDPSKLRGTAEQTDWTPLFDTVPCMPTTEYSLPLQSGGRMSFISEREVLITVGDFNLISSDRDEGPFPQDMNSSLGKIIKIDTENGQSTVVSRGHRNPQGLTISSDGTVWEAEHGPRGGDEINIIVSGGNYGWPARTFGTSTDSYVWPPSDTPGSHAGYMYPFFSFVPSIGISNIVEVTGDEFPLWRGDLLVSSLTAASLYRIRIREGRAVYSERIRIGGRIRDIEQSPNGILYMKIDDRDHVLVVTRGDMSEENAARPGMPSDAAIPSGLGACVSCHTLRENQPHGTGPNLWSVYERKIGGEADYEYSSSLRSQGGAWGDDELQEFLADPDSFAPGTKMTPQGLSDQDIARAISALKALR